MKNIPIHTIEKQVSKIIKSLNNISEQQLYELAYRTIIEGAGFLHIREDGTIEICYPYEELETTGI